MPGHILTAKCACGFEQGVSPGATLSEPGVIQSHVIAYAANGRGLVTIESDDAARANLTVIKDPALAAEWFDARNASWGPYRCPKCVNESMRLWFGGNWD